MTKARIRISTRAALGLMVAVAMTGGLPAGALAAGPVVASQGTGTSQPRIINGDPVHGTYPWMVFLPKRESSSGPYHRHCGATLIAPRYVLTAAHCAVNVQPNRFRLFIGRMDITDTDGEVRFVDSILIHPDYDPQDNRFDAAILHLTVASEKEPLRLAGHRYRSLWNGNEDKARVLGWGRREDDSVPDRLERADVRIVPDDRCAESYELHPATMVCAGGRTRDTCQGDSGGPMMVLTDQGWRQIGVTSFGIGCGDGFPGVYAQVGSGPLRTWVQANT